MTPDSDPGLPTFVVIGAKKCGTTSLAAYLGAHPDVFVTHPKEPEFFRVDRTAQELASYRALFAGAGRATVRGEASTDYTKAPEFVGAARRIHSLVPAVKLVYVVRDPIERTQSHYAFKVMQGVESRPLVGAVCGGSMYVDCSRYAYQLEPFLDLFPREQLLVIGARNLLHDRVATMQRVFEFIGVDALNPVPNLERESARTADVRVERQWAQRVRHLAGRTPLHRLPSPLKLRLYHATRRTNPIPDTTIPSELGRWLWDLFAADLERFRAISDVELQIGERP